MNHIKNSLNRANGTLARELYGCLIGARLQAGSPETDAPQRPAGPRAGKAIPKAAGPGRGAGAPPASSRFGAVLALALAATLFGGRMSLQAQGTAFTYQGRLNNGTNPATGLYNFEFSLFTAPSGGSQVGSTVTTSGIGVTNGLFTVPIDFGSGAFTGATNWLQIGVETNGLSSFTALTPRQELTPTPYAIFAEGASTLTGLVPSGGLGGTYSGAVTFSNSNNSFSGSGAGLTNVNASTLGGLPAGNFWQVGGNSGVPTGSNFVGNIDNQFLDLHANGVRAMRLRLLNDVLGLYTNAPNVVGGSSVNLTGINVVGATIAGGGGNGTNGVAYFNEVTADFGTVGGGSANNAGRNAAVSGGAGNSAGGTGSFIGGGGFDGTTASGNSVQDVAATIGGGLGNSIPSGGAYSFIGGGALNLGVGNYGTVGGGYGNIVSSPYATVGGGYENQASGAWSTVAGGNNNKASFGSYGDSTVGGGDGNTASGDDSTVSGGAVNNASAQGATVGGGQGNSATGYMSTVPGGFGNTALGTESFAAGLLASATQNNSFVWSDGSQSPFSGAAVASAFNALASGGVFIYNGSNGVSIDNLDQNSGSIDYGLRFGAGSGEGIGSQRTAGANQYGLDFYTASNERMTIAKGGFVGINTTSPSERLEVNGNYILIDGGQAADTNGPIDAYIGGDGSGSDVQIGSMNSLITNVGFWNYAANAWMHIGCSAITIHGGSDVAEPFPISNKETEIPQGAVMVIDEQIPGQLKLSDQAYDTRVAGVLSGANGISPGIQMQQEGILEGGRNVALTGRVYALADATNGAIHPGDLLTTSATPGHAMKVTDHERAHGAILGKAMTGLSEGKGMVLVLVTLQ
jgi:hypothetical protein